MRGQSCSNSASSTEGPAISQTDPYQPTCLRLPIRQMKEVFILGYYDSATLAGVPPDVSITRLTQSCLHDVNAIVTQRGKKSG